MMSDDEAFKRFSELSDEDKEEVTKDIFEGMRVAETMTQEQLKLLSKVMNAARKNDITTKDTYLALYKEDSTIDIHAKGIGIDIVEMIAFSAEAMSKQLMVDFETIIGMMRKIHYEKENDQ